MARAVLLFSATMSATSGNSELRPHRRRERDAALGLLQVGFVEFARTRADSKAWLLGVATLRSSSSLRRIPPECASMALEIHNAAKVGDTEGVRLALEAGANVNSKDVAYVRTPKWRCSLPLYAHEARR